MTTNFSYAHRILPEHLAALKEYTSQPPVQIGALASALGLKVVLATLPMNISGSIQPDGAGGTIIRINRFESKERQRFTIAHEVAHYLIHRDQIDNGVVDSVLYRSRLSSRTEAEANKLAADILMPSGLVFNAMNRLGGKIDEEGVSELASEFGVSRQAMSIRVG